MKVAVTGSSGLIGTALVASLRADGHDVIRLVRRPPRAAGEVRWDPRAADAGLLSPGPGGSSGTRGSSGGRGSSRMPGSSGMPGLSALDGLGACVHLAGAGVADHRWTARYKTEIRASRILGTRVLAGALAKLGQPPATLVAASAIGWYGDTGGREVDESAPAGPAFLSRLVQDWEAAASPAADTGVRVVHLRSGLVLTPRGGFLARLLPLARYGLCPRFSSGRQVMSWISLSDEIGAIRFLLDREDLSGAFNLTAPAPVTNAEFTAALNTAALSAAVSGAGAPGAATSGPVASGAAGRRDGSWRRALTPLLRVPAPVLRLAVGEAAVELLTSARVSSRRLQEAGYQFRYPALPEALAAELASR